MVTKILFLSYIMLIFFIYQNIRKSKVKWRTLNHCLCPLIYLNDLLLLLLSIYNNSTSSHR
jgi:hypothetical protein